MRTFYFLLLTVIFVSGCSKAKTNKNWEDCSRTKNTYTFQENARVDTASYPNFFYSKVVSGNKLVFDYREDTYNVCPEIQDGVGYFYLLFEVDPTAASFTYTTADLQTAMVYFNSRCGECSQESRNAFLPESATIKGVRISANSWQVDYDIVIKGNWRKTGTGLFTK